MKIKICLLVFGVIITLALPGFAAMESENYSIKTSVMSSGGVPMRSASFKSNHSLGQTLISDPVSSEGYDLYAGFWYTIATIGCIWDLEPADGDVDGFDLFQFVNPPHNASDIESFSSEFGRTYCFD